MSEANGLICAYVLDGQGGGREVGWTEVNAWQPGQGALWVHLDRSKPGAHSWLREQSGVEPVVGEALLAQESRPRSVATANGLLVIMRGVNLQPQADPEDMVSIRMWIEPERVITLRHQRLMAVQDIREMLEAGTGPRDTAGLLVRTAFRLLERMGPVIDQLESEVDDLEEQVLTAQSYELRSSLADLRRKAITLRRYIAPQREAISRVVPDEVPWFTPMQLARLREVADRITRYVEDLDAARERAAVTQEELAGRLSEQMNKTMYVLSVVASVFMPLGLLTGLLGINVAGIPGAENPWAFTIFCAILLAIVAVQLALFRKLKWI